MRDVVWSVAHPSISGAERCLLQQTDAGWRLSGQVVASYDKRPLDVRYDVELDSGWLTRTVLVHADRLTRPRGLELVRESDGRWKVDGSRRPDLDGCTDVDLGISPSTNTLPIRRLHLDVGQEASVQVAWVRFPELQVDPGWQRYRPIATNLWRYSSDGFTAELAVDEDGLVVTYGNDLWRMVTR
ncbi:MAG: putative glycolipid-binding domain-containing protein [Actinomycetota bacterium]|nr:putative glycolipid-binding domain-containing protein [Actinomycetota bacterium]